MNFEWISDYSYQHLHEILNFYNNALWIDVIRHQYQTNSNWFKGEIDIDQCVTFWPGVEMFDRSSETSLSQMKVYWLAFKLIKEIVKII